MTRQVYERDDDELCGLGCCHGDCGNGCGPGCGYCGRCCNCPPPDPHIAATNEPDDDAPGIIKSDPLWDMQRRWWKLSFGHDDIPAACFRQCAEELRALLLSPDVLVAEFSGRPAERDQER